MASRSLFQRAAPQLTKQLNSISSPTTSSLSRRELSSNGLVAVEKLRAAIEEYRLRHDTYELPSRVKKNLLSAAKTEENYISPISLQQVLVNIGASHISLHDVETIFSEIGEDGYIPADRMLNMI